jgi:hypothetical protein
MNTLRIARASNDLNRISKMYCDGLGLRILSSFQDHAGFDGVIIGNTSLSYHLEFTLQYGVKAPSSHSDESLLVFYLSDKNEFSQVEAQMEKAGFMKVESHNPYWDQHGCTFEDFEKYRVVLCRNEWK